MECHLESSHLRLSITLTGTGAADDQAASAMQLGALRRDSEVDRRRMDTGNGRGYATHNVGPDKCCRCLRGTGQDRANFSLADGCLNAFDGKRHQVKSSQTDVSQKGSKAIDSEARSS
jgi:hypothetical protein